MNRPGARYAIVAAIAVAVLGAAAVLQPLPGADDPRYVHTNAVWSPDGSYLVFARAEARDAYPQGSTLAARANDPNETQIQYDLYRIPFNEGRGGEPVRIVGASQNGMSNSFPKVSPDGRWIVFVQARNGQLMRPDGKLHIVPAGGGEARLMRANTPLMNSWHSFSPNGRWLVFSSKSRSPYTQMFLTHGRQPRGEHPGVREHPARRAAEDRRAGHRVLPSHRRCRGGDEQGTACGGRPAAGEGPGVEPGRRRGPQQPRVGPGGRRAACPLRSRSTERPRS